MPERMHLTEAAALALPLSADRDRYLVWDDRLKGFCVSVSRSTRAWRVQWDLPSKHSLRRRVGRKSRGETISLVVGRCDLMSAKAARAEASRLLAAIRTGQDPRRPTGEGITLNAAWAAYRTALENRGASPRTVDGYEYAMGLLERWAETPLAALASDQGAAEMVREHAKLTAANGRAAANYAMRTISVVYSHARRTHSRLPIDPPTRAVTFHKMPPRRTGMSLADLPGWAAELRATVKSPLRRELHIFTLLTALRRETVVGLHWADVGAEWIEIKEPKGGVERAFKLPVTPAIKRCLARAKKAAGETSPWVFPSPLSETGHVTEIKEDGELAVGHDLRRAFRTVAAELGVGRLSTKLIMNHGLGRDVTDDYAGDAGFRSMVRRDMKKVTTAIEKAIRNKRGRNK